MHNPFATLLGPISKPHTRSHYKGVGQAGGCQVEIEHQPQALRFVWHHICPQACGGKTEPDNLASLCDNCHYAVHVLLAELKATGTIALTDPPKNPDRIALAQKGYDEALRLGTVNRIPEEARAVQ